MTTTPTSPSSAQSPPTKPSPTTKAEPKCALLVMCVECGQGVETSLPLDQMSFALQLAQHAWFVTVMTPPNQGPEVPILFGALCGACAQRVYPPDVMRAAEDRRQKMLAAVASAAAPAAKGIAP